MNIFEKFIRLFKLTKAEIAEVFEKIDTFCDEHREQIKVLMKIMQMLYSRGNGHKKMQNVVVTVLSAVGAGQYAADHASGIADYVEAKCQQVYDDLIAEGGLS